MLARLRDHLRHQPVAYLALFVALGGTGAYAAETIGTDDVINDSLLSEDIKNATLTGGDLREGTIGSGRVADDALTSTDVKDDTLTAADIKNGAIGSSDIAANSLGGGRITDNSLKGTDIQESSLDLASPTLRPGDTLTGVYGAWGAGNGTGGADYTNDTVNFRVPLANDLVSTDVHFVPQDAAADPNCPGTAVSPDADAGHLCIYEKNSGNRTFTSILNPRTSSGPGASKDGFLIYFTIPAADGSHSTGAWAVTAP
jgi:hypothetical protein